MRFERNPVADTELQHCLVGMQLADQPEALHDAMIQVDEFSLRQMIMLIRFMVVAGLYVCGTNWRTGNLNRNPRF